MTIVVLVILVAIWSVYLTSWFRARARTRAANSMSSFNQHLSVLQRAQPYGVPTMRAANSLTARQHDPLVRPPAVRGLGGGPPITVADARRRRRDVLVLLGVLTVAATVPYLAFGGVFAYLAFAVAVVLASYLMLLLRAQRLALVDDRPHLYAVEDDAWEDEGWEDGEWEQAWDNEWVEADGTYGYNHIAAAT